MDCKMADKKDNQIYKAIAKFTTNVTSWKQEAVNNSNIMAHIKAYITSKF